MFIQCLLDYSVCLFGSKLGYLCQVCWFLVCLLLLTEMLNPLCLVTRLHLLFFPRAYSASAALPTTLQLSVRLCLSTFFFSAKPDLVQISPVTLFSANLCLLQTLLTFFMYSFGSLLCSQFLITSLSYWTPTSKCLRVPYFTDTHLPKLFVILWLKC